MGYFESVSAIRVDRDGDVVSVYGLLPPDLSGRTHWAVLARLRGGDFIEIADGLWSPVTDCTDEQIVHAVLRGAHV